MTVAEKIAPRLLLLAIALVACSLIVPATAFAAPVTSPVCDGPVSTVYEFGFQSRDGGPFYLAADCPDMRMQMTAPASRGERVAYYKMVKPNLSKVTATLAGGPSSTSGVTLRLRICSLLECGRALTRSSGGAAVNGELNLTDGIPANPMTLLIDAECTRAAGCSVQPDTIIRNLALTVEDDAPPVVTLSDAWGNHPPEPWVINFDEYLYVGVDEGDSPNEAMWFQMDGDPENHTDCYSLPGDWIDCGIFDSGHGMIKLPNFEGPKRITVFVRDGAGNVGSSSVLVTRDASAPGAPENLGIGANEAGWINRYAFTASWTNPIDEGATESDVVGAQYRIVDESGYEWRNSFVEGEGIDSLELFVPYRGKYTLEVRLVDRSENYGPYQSVEFKYDSTLPDAPNIAMIPIVNASSIDSGLTITWSDSEYWDLSFAGVCTYRTAINSLPRYEPTTGADVTTLPAETKFIELTQAELAAMPDGVRYVHVAGTSCADALGPAADARLVIDRKLPTVSSEPAAGGWLAPGKPLVLKADDSDPNNPYAGIAKLSYTIDGGPEQTVNGPKVSINLPQGMHRVVYWAEDLAGNRSSSSEVSSGVEPEGASIVDAGTDALAPNAAFGAIDPADPALINANVTDRDSGVSDAWIEYRSPGSPTWARLIGNSVGDAQRSLQARFPDDDSLPSGEYLLRIVARDRAGNLSTTTTRVDGSSASLTLPLRRHPAISLTVAAGPKSKPSAALTVPFGSSVFARGTLRDVDGTPLVGVPVVLSESISGGQRRQFEIVTTGAAGEFAAPAKGGPSRVLIASFRGDSLRGSASASATFNVRGSVSLNKLPKKVPGGKYFHLRGKVNPGSVPFPKSGVRVQIQHRSGSGWSGLFAEDRTASDGSFEIRWKQKTRGKAIKMTFRAAVATEAGWPYATGYSQERKVVIR